MILEKVITLVIIRTPLQAWIVQKVLDKENIEDFDIIYITQDDSEEDRYYYNQLYNKAKKASYIFVQRQKFSFLNTLLMRIQLRKWYRIKSYSLIIYASITALVANSLVTKFSKAALITFDDGAANIVASDEYHHESQNKRYLIYRYLLKASSINFIKSRIIRHYTLYPGFINIVDSARLRYLDGWSNKVSNQSDTKTYFIGSPFEEAMNQEQIARLEIYAKNLNISKYVTHPRERNILNIGAEVLKKYGRIAEEAIIADSGDCSICLVGWFSTVMLNMGALCTSRIVLLPKDSPQTPELFELSKKAGCTPVLF